jgi:hypothetical protein
VPEVAITRQGIQVHTGGNRIIRNVVTKAT